MKDELLPCPFCGKKTALVMDKTWGGQGWSCAVHCLGCGANIGVHPTEEQAVEAWNTRAERTCHMDHTKWPGESVCSACGQHFDECYERYCPNCGAKVVDDG